MKKQTRWIGPAFLAALSLLLIVRGLGGLTGGRSSKLASSPERASELVQIELAERAADGAHRMTWAGAVDTATESPVADGGSGDGAGSNETTVSLQVESDLKLPEGGRGFRLYGGDRYRIDRPEWLGDLDGSGRAEGTIGSGDWFVAVHAAPSMLWELNVQAGTESTTLHARIPETRACAGRCVTFDDTPLPGVTLYAVAVADSSRAFPVGEADESGAFRVVLGSEGEPVGLFAGHPALGTSLCEWVDVMDPNESELTLRFLDRRARVRGVVRSDSGPLLEACEVRVHQESGRLERLRPSKHPAVMTDSQGRFEIGELHAGVARIRIRRDGFMPFDEKFELRDGETRELDLTLTASETAWVRLLAASGRIPIEGGLVCMTVDREGAPHLEREARSDEDGLARIQHLPEGRLRLGAHHPEHGYAPSREVTRAELAQTIELVLQEGHRRVGRVRDERGWPVQLETARVELFDPHGMLYFADQISCTVQGEFELAHVSPGSGIHIFVYGEEFEAYDRMFQDTDELLVQLRRRSWPAELSGRVIDGDGFPLSGVFVSFAAAGGARVPAVYSRDDGTFVVPQSPIGEFFLVVSKDGFGSPVLGPFEAVEGANDLGDLVLSAGARLSVDVSSPGVASLPRGYCCLRDLDGMILETSRIEEGVARFEGVAAADYLLSTHVPGFSAVQQRITLSDDGSHSTDVVLQDGVTLRIRCQFPTQVIETRPRVRVELLQESGAVFRATIVEDAGGGFSTALSLPRGRYEVRAWREGQSEEYQAPLDLREASFAGDELQASWPIP